VNYPTKAIILAILVFTIVSACFVYAVFAQSTLVRAEASASQPHVGDTLTINIKISDAQNLYGVDITLNWNTATLKLVSATPQLGVESHPGGVLHETSSYPIELVNNDASQIDGEYHLLATSTGSTTPAFTGSGTVATLTFTVTSTGDTGLALNDDKVELSQLASDGTINLVTPTTTVDPVTPINAGVSVSPSASATPVPEFPTTIIIAVLITLAFAAVSTKLVKNRATLPTKI
jgi:hypothetical protein